MKIITKLILKSLIVISIEGGLQFLALGAYFNLSLNFPPETLKILYKYGIPVFAFLLLVFAVMIPVMGGWLMVFVYRLSKGEHFTDEELQNVQRRLVNFPFRVALLGLLMWGISIPLLATILRTAFGWGFYELVIAILGGVVGGLLSMPLSVYGTSNITYPLMDIVSELSPAIPRGGRFGKNLPLSIKITLSFLTIIFSYVFYVGVAGYSRVIVYQMREIYGGLFYNFFALSGSMLGLTLMLGLLSAREITAMLDRLKKTAAHIAKGEFDERARVITNDEIGELAGAINSMAERLDQDKQMIAALQESLDNSAEELLTATRKILDIAQEHSSGATQQSVAINQVVATHEMILDTAGQVAESAAQSDKMAANVLSATKEGIKRTLQTLDGIEQLSKQVEEISKSMKDVEDCMRKVTEAVRVIDDIAERTNLLSLNAALEAAGAGSSGQRFAVLAEQIRRLAEKSHTSSQSIGSIIEEINLAAERAVNLTRIGMQSAAAGVAHVRDIRSGLDEVNSIASVSSELARKIDFATRQQRSSLQQISATLKDLASTTDKTLDGTKSTEMELGGLEQLAEKIKSMLSIQKDSKIW